MALGGILINRAGQVLLEKRSDDGSWRVPGGRVEPGESVTNAAIREVRDEAGLAIKIIRLLGVYSDPKCRIVTYADNGYIRHKIDIIFEGRVASGKLTLSVESQELSFFDLTRRPNGVTPTSRAPLADYRQGRAGAIR